MSKVVFRDPLAVLRMAKFEIGRVIGTNVMVSCPFHVGDSDPSCSVEIERLVFRCHGCLKEGRFDELLAMKVVGETSPAAIQGVKRLYKDFLDEFFEGEPLDPGRVEAFHRTLMADNIESTTLVAILAQKKGITRETAQEYVIGWDGERYTIPIRDKLGNVVNIRYRSLERGVEPKIRSHKGRGEARLFPISTVDRGEEWIWICEGELKALLLLQWGLAAICGTGGAGTWDPEWSTLFRGKKVAIVYDIDPSGRGGSMMVARSLVRVADEIRIIQLPLDPAKYPTGDVTDWVLNEDGNKDRLLDLLAASEPFVYQPDLETPSPIELPIIPLSALSELDNPKYHDHHVQVDAIVAAEEPELYRVPIAWTVGCQEDQKVCRDCPVHQTRKHDFAPDPFVRVELLKMLDVTDEAEKFELRRRTEIPVSCRAHTIRVKERVNVRALELIPDLDSKNGEDRDSTMAAYYVSRGSDDRRSLHGCLHTIRGFPTTDPKGNRLVMLVHDLEASAGSLDEYRVDTLAAELAKFQPTEWTLKGLTEQIDRIYRDITANVSHIYGRQDLHFVADLAYHSVLEIPFNHRNIRGWVEACVIGDSGQGKSQCIEAMRGYYRLGDVAVGASCTGAGLLGSVQESARKRRWVYRWGKIPLNDRRLVILEEVSGLPYEIIQRLRDARSSGRHEDTKAKLTRVRTRTRMIWLANPRFNRSMGEIQHGVTALRELFGDDPDVRRVDVGFFVGRGEVALDAMRNGTTTVEHVFTSDLGRALVLWAWSRSPEQVRFDAEAVSLCRSLGRKLSSKFSGRIPLILDTEIDEKLARLSASLAARTFSHLDGDCEILRVRACHVEYIAAFLDKTYSSSICGYDAFSERVKLEESVADSASVQKAFTDIVLTAESTAEFLLEVTAFGTRDLAAVASMEYAKAEQFIGVLLRARAVRPNPAAPNSYTKTQGFTELLKRMVNSKTLTDTTAEDKYANQEF